MEKVIRVAKADPWSKLKSGFCVAIMPFGEKYDYFPFGTPPHITKNGMICICGEIVRKYRHNGNEFRCIYKDPDFA